MPQYKCFNCGQTFWDDADLEGDACNRCDDGYVEVVNWVWDDYVDLEELYDEDYKIE